MRTITLAHLVAGLAATLTAAVVLAAPIEIPTQTGNWSQVQVGQITLLSDAPDSATATMSHDIQYLRAAMAKTMRRNIDARLSASVLVFAEEAAFRPYAEALLGSAEARNGGVFLTGSNGCSIAAARASLSEDNPALFHELAHYYIAGTGLPMPLWLSEGLAELYSTFTRTGDTIVIGKPIAQHLQTLRTGQLIPLRELVAMTASSKGYDESSRSGMFYAESWALTHDLLIGNPKREGQVLTFLMLLARATPMEESFKGAFADDYTAIENELKTYVQRTDLPRLTFAAADLQTEPLGKPAPVPRADLLFNLGELLFRSGSRNFADAERLLRAAVEADPNQAEAWALLGTLKDQSGNETEANGFFDKALQVGSNDYLANLLAGERIVARAQRAGTAPAATLPPEIQRARELFAKCVELKPGFPRGYAGLGSTYLFQTDGLEAGIEALEKALVIAPAQYDATYNLVLLYARTGQIDKASTLIDRVLSHAPNADLAAEARRVVDKARAEQAATQAAATPTPGAATAGAPAPTATEPPELSDAEVERIQQQFKRELATFQEALNKANTGDYDTALQMVDKLLATSKTESIILRAKDLRQQLVERINRRKH